MINIELAICEGWKAVKNDRFGEALELRWIDADTGRILWRYAPRLDDEHVFREAFAFLKEYDARLGGLKDLIARVDGRSYRMAGCAPHIDISTGNRQSPATCGAGGVRGQGQPCPAQTEGKP